MWNKEIQNEPHARLPLALEKLWWAGSTSHREKHGKDIGGQLTFNLQFSKSTIVHGTQSPLELGQILDPFYPRGSNQTHQPTSKKLCVPPGSPRLCVKSRAGIHNTHRTRRTLSSKAWHSDRPVRMTITLLTPYSALRDRRY
jgi:hypothetical protein